MRIALHGATGRMGKAIVRIVHEKREDQIVGAIAAADAPEQGADVGEVAGVGHIGVAVTADHAIGLLGADVVIDFSIATAVGALTRAVKRAKVALVSGTTGLDPASAALLNDAAEVAPVLWTSNMSFGIEVVAEITRLAIASLGPDYDVEMVEVHHHHKVDSPSGTALRLAEAVRQARAGLVLKHGRQGADGPRKKNELAVMALRGGDVIGDHTIHLLGPGERIEITHRATQRDLFAHGALRAARWLSGKKPGRYALADLLA
ncbi:MAG TPA: 4-hydroxy-tetrahydrodipicolinate reductase [Polyangiaceae bacterium]|nr:4-hydroxy-tetrahydrodipicolinate reductase [Polyangiaceae bacterium]